MRFVHSAPLTASPPCVCVLLLQAIALEQPVGFVYYDGGKVRYCNAPLQSYLEDKMMVGCLIGLDDVWQGWQMPLTKSHLGQIMMVHEMAQTGDWEPLLVRSGASTHDAQVPVSVSSARCTARATAPCVPQVPKPAGHDHKDVRPQGHTRIRTRWADLTALVASQCTTHATGMV